MRSTVQSRHLLERHDLARKEQSLRGGTIVDATIIAAPSSTKNKDGERDSDMHQTQERQPVLLRDESAHFGYAKVRYRGLAKNTAQVLMSNPGL
ncbi:hypothetical protein ACU16_19885 [Xanthomonas oryzae pv. oryzicola]|nr:hypothetical protein ACU16_19885 [Xanthomonas oryzae pv. oryzicola]AKO09935.1 hypothetical protein ACU17_19900 [Xanthomonas oryzae pv. oryzicola]